MHARHRAPQAGFTLVEVIVGVAVFLSISIATYNAYVALIKLANASQSRILGVELADEQFEIVRNMPYTSVGLTDGIPVGVLPRDQTLVRGGFTYNSNLTIRALDLSTSTVQASTKLVVVKVTCTSCAGFTPIELTGQVAPANLQSASDGGALVVQVFDSAGVSIQGAAVNVQSLATSTVADSDTTNNEGLLGIVGVPPGANTYRITVTKSGYSTARTYPIGGAGNPNPTVPDATVLKGSVTMVSLSIDKLSELDFVSVGPLCTPVSDLHFHMTGAKEIGAGVPKYSQDLTTNGSGILKLPSMEWDTYTVVPTDTTDDVSGITPFSPIALNAGNAQTIQFIAVPRASDSLQVSVEDDVTKLPLSGATVRLSDGAGYDMTETTGQGYVSQTDWSGGSGQADYSAPNRYFYSDGYIDTATSSGSIVMAAPLGEYSTIATGTLESSTFDIGTAGNFYALNWKPSSQPALTGPGSVKLQFATNPTSTSTPWNYFGPDGTTGSYFTVPGMQINPVHNGNEFVRYAVYLNTQTATVTPSVSDVSFTYTSGCTPPGQVIFQGLSAGNYTLTVSKAGYALDSIPVTVGAGWQSQTVLLGP